MDGQPTPIPNPNKALWEKGDFTRIAAAMRESGEALVKSFGVKQGMKVLDVGCGDGTTAIPAALAGADVLGVDIARNLVAAGNLRTKMLKLANIHFEEGDASNLANLKDKSFDLVISIFGAMFAPKPFDVAKALVRVTKRGGRIMMGNWIPGDPTLVAQILKIGASYMPPPPEGFISPGTWGHESNVVDRFVQAGIPADHITCEKDTYTFNYKGSASSFLEQFRNYYGPTMNAYDAAGRNGKAEELHAELDMLFNKQNQAKTNGTTSIPASFLRVNVRVP